MRGATGASSASACFSRPLMKALPIRRGASVRIPPLVSNGALDLVHGPPRVTPGFGMRRCSVGALVVLFAGYPLPSFQNAGDRLHYEVRGAGRPVVFLHGGTVDFRGHGQSDKLHDAGAYGTANVAGDVTSLW